MFCSEWLFLNRETGTGKGCICRGKWQPVVEDLHSSGQVKSDQRLQQAPLQVIVQKPRDICFGTTSSSVGYFLCDLGEVA